MHYSHMAEHVRSRGRGDDTMLVHMTPHEVGGLQALAMAHGGSLTINPETGLPEAGWLGKLLPTLLGAAGMAFGIPPIWMGALGLVGGTAITGSLKEGIMAGLGAYGGASLAGGLGLGQTLGHVGADLHLAGSVARTAAPAIGSAASSAAPAAADAAPLLGPVPGGTVSAGIGAATPATTAATTVAKHGLGAIAQNFGNYAKAGLNGVPGFVQKAAPMVAGMGVLNSVSGAMSGSTMNPMTGAVDNSFQGPYYEQKRSVVAKPTLEELKNTSGERNWFDTSVPEVYNVQGQLVQPGSDTAQGTPIMMPMLNAKAKKGQPMYSFAPTYYKGLPPSQDPYQQTTGYAEGGTVHMQEGGFVIPARAVAEAGNGYTDAGFERFAKMGGIPLRGRGDGVSDDIPARIGSQEARVAAGEVYMPPAAVRRAGGAQKLYALVDQAHKARKRGENSPVARGLGAL